MIDSVEDKRRRDRSPSFPYISLREAVEKLEALYKQFTRHPARIQMLAPVMGYSPTSSSLLRAIAALKSFGLVDESGSGADRKVSVSDLGQRIVADKRPGIRDEAIRQAFDACDIFAFHREKWGPRRPPNEACESELHLDHGFTSDAARKFISVYDDSVAYAKVWDSDASGLGEAPSSPVISGAQTVISGVVNPDAAKADAPSGEPVAKSIGMSVATYPVAEGACSLSWPNNISARSARKLQKWLQLMLDDLAETAEERAIEDEGGQG